MARPIPDQLLPLRYDADGYHVAVPTGATIRRDVDARTVDAVIITSPGEPLVITAAIEDSALEAADLQVNGQLGLLLSKYRDRSPSLAIHDRALVGVDGSDDAVLADVSWGERDRHRSLLLCARLSGRRAVTLQVTYPDGSDDRLHGLAAGVVDSLTIAPTATPGLLVERFRELNPGQAFD